MFFKCLINYITTILDKQAENSHTTKKTAAHFFEGFFISFLLILFTLSL